jgi:phospholipid-binding lipoprotein MlaA
MKSLCLTACLLVFLRPALGAENPIAQATGPSVSSTDDKPFRDPFASENQQAKAPPKIKDPLQPMNRAFFQFNDKLYFWIVKPAGKVYNKVVPRPARQCVNRVFGNVKYPIYLVNNLLQGKVKAAGIETGRFVVNSTVGVGGLFDPAKRWKIEAHPANFDQTLGFYGLGPGIYFDWPLFGPSSARGTAGLGADGMLSPWVYIGGVGVVYGVPAYRELNSASLGIGEYESFKKTTLDPYVAMRSAYYESRAEAVEQSRARNNAPRIVSIPRGGD